MDITEMRSKYWRLKSSQDQLTPTVDRQMQMLQIELQIEMVEQLQQMNRVMARIGILNFEEIALRLEDLFDKAD